MTVPPEVPVDVEGAAPARSVVARLALVVAIVVVVAAAVMLVQSHPWRSAIANPVACAEGNCSGSTTTSAGSAVGPLTVPLLFEVPSAISGSSFANCEQDDTPSFVAASVQEQVACNTSGIAGIAEDYVLYLAFASGAAADTFFEQSLVQSNGLHDGVGDCIAAVLAGDVVPTGSYCEQETGPKGIGRIVGEQGPSFAVGPGLNVAQLCAGSGVETAGDTFAVEAWTDPQAPVVTIAVTCGGAVINVAADLRRGKLLLTDRAG